MQHCVINGIPFRSFVYYKITQLLRSRHYWQQLRRPQHRDGPGPRPPLGTINQGTALEETPIAELLHETGQLKGLRLADGRHLPLPVLYASPTPPWHQASPLPAQLGCELTELGLVRVNAQYQTTMPGVLAAGDCCTGMHQVAGAIAAGNMAGAMLSR